MSRSFQHMSSPDLFIANLEPPGPAVLDETGRPESMRLSPDGGRPLPVRPLPFPFSRAAARLSISTPKTALQAAQDSQFCLRSRAKCPQDRYSGSWSSAAESESIYGSPETEEAAPTAEFGIMESYQS